jgi:SAM-dependent methyltransferase
VAVNALDEGRCSGCELTFAWRAGVLDVIGESARETVAAEVEAFYSVSPFPGYAPGDDARTLLDRGRASPFLRAFDEALPADAVVLDVGCGTAQLAAFLALSAPRRRVIGVDGCRASLEHAAEFRDRARGDNLQLVRADLFDLPMPRESWSLVISRGVVHHTPDPDLAIEKVAQLVAPGGVLVLGFYETWARAFHRFRRTLSRLPLRSRERPFVWLDPLLRGDALDAEKKRIWIDDQYLHPAEVSLPLPHVVKVLARLGLRTLRTVPPVLAAGMLADGAELTPAAATARRLGWLAAGPLDPDAGLICVVARRALAPRA